MNGIKKERKDFRLFNKTGSGASKFALFIMGIILGLVSSTLFGYMCGNYNATGDYRYFDWILFIAIFLLILTGELIGIYFGAYEEYVLNKKREEKLNKVQKEEKVIVKEKKIDNKKNVKSKTNKDTKSKVNSTTTKRKKTTK